MDNVSITALSKPTRLEQQQTILALFGYRRCEGGAKEELEFKARRIAFDTTDHDLARSLAVSGKSTRYGSWV
jgi:hypothetical protein